MTRRGVTLSALLGAVAWLWPAVRNEAAQSPPAAASSSRTKVVLLGTGTPGLDPDRSGPATAVVVNDTAYLVDFGPGVVRRASAAARSRGIDELEPTKLRVAFVTHLHSDHAVGYPDLIFSPWTVGRRVQFAAKYHTTTAQLAELARQAKPRLLVLYHHSSVSPEELMSDMVTAYAGPFVIGRDLDVY